MYVIATERSRDPQPCQVTAPSKCEELLECDNTVFGHNNVNVVRGKEIECRVRVFTCSKILRYLRVAWSTRSRTVHPALQGTTTAASPKVTVTFIAPVSSNVFLNCLKNLSKLPVVSRSGAAPRLDTEESGTCLSKLEQQVSQVRMKSRRSHLSVFTERNWCTTSYFQPSPSHKTGKESVTTAAECDFLSC